MKAIVLSLLAICVAGSITWADTNDDISVSCVAKKIQAKNQGLKDDMIQQKREEWGYAVTVENKTFRDLGNLEVKYMILYTHETLGVKGPPQKLRLKGSFSIKGVPANDKVSFDTNGVMLSSSTLIGSDGGYMYFGNGAKSSVADALTGIWIRIYQNGALIEEFTKPSDLPNKEKWDAGTGE